jgi:hypothetical protein
MEFYTLENRPSTHTLNSDGVHTISNFTILEMLQDIYQVYSIGTIIIILMLQKNSWIQNVVVDQIPI